MINKTKGLLILICLMLGTDYLVAQTKDTAELTLNSAIQEALANNFQIRISDLENQIAKNNNTWLETGLLPSLNLNLGSNISLRNQQRSPISFVAGTFGSNGLTGEIQLSWTLFNGFRVYINKRKLQALQDLSGGNLSVIVENTIQAVSLAYYDVLLQTQQFKLLQELKALSVDKYKLNEEKKKLGTVALVDYLQFKTTLLKDSINCINQGLVLKNAKRQLNFLLSRPLNQPLELADYLNINPKVFDFQQLKKELFNNNNVLKNQIIQYQIAKENKALSKASFFPTLSLQSGASGEVSGVFNDSSSIFGIRSSNYYARLSMTYNVFNSRKTARAYRNAKIKLDQENIKLDEQKFKLEQELNQVYEAYINAIKIYKLNQSLFESARMTLDLVAQKYDLGVMSSFDYRNTQSQYMQVLIDKTKASNSVLENHIKLVRLTGGLVK